MGTLTIGAALTEKRRELGLEKGKAAAIIGMSRTTYSSYEQDAQRPSIDVFPALATFLSVSIEDFLTLYGATCVAQARSSLGRASAESARDSVELSPQSIVETANESSYSEPEPVHSAPTATLTETTVTGEVTKVDDRCEALVGASEISLEVAEDQDESLPAGSDSAVSDLTPSNLKTADSEHHEVTSQKKKKKKKKGKKG
jgi:transcriptional regulator with XRE-family HTH domain